MDDVDEVQVCPRAVESIVQIRVRPVVEVRLDAAYPRPLLRLITEVVLTLDLPVAAPLQKADFRVELITDLRVAKPSAPQLVGIGVKHAACVVRSTLLLR